MLKGRRILTKDYFGTVLNDAEKEPAVNLAVTRQRLVDHDPGSMFRAPHTREWWVVVDRELGIPWCNIGVHAFCKVMPKWLYVRVLYPKPKRVRNSKRRRNSRR